MAILFVGRQIMLVDARPVQSNGVWSKIVSQTTRFSYSACALVSRCFVYHTHEQVVVASVIAEAAARGREPLDSVDSPRWSWEHSLLFL